MSALYLLALPTSMPRLPPLFTNHDHTTQAAFGTLPPPKKNDNGNFRMGAARVSVACKAGILFRNNLSSMGCRH